MAARLRFDWAAFQRSRIEEKLRAARTFIRRGQAYAAAGNEPFAEGCVLKAERKLRQAEALGWVRPGSKS